MGEYASYRGRRVKIGTCEDMLYLRADQAHLVEALPGNVDPMNARHREHIRFRFPWPEEDGIEPGAFEPFKGEILRDVRSTPGCADHRPVQFRAGNGYLVSLPCPESGDTGVLSLASDGSDHAYRVHRNGHAGASELIQQAWRGGLLVSVLQCRACHAAWRLPELSHAQPVIDALHAEADAILRRKGSEACAVRLRTIADRVLAGYVKAAAELEPAHAGQVVHVLSSATGATLCGLTDVTKGLPPGSFGASSPFTRCERCHSEPALAAAR